LDGYFEGLVRWDACGEIGYARDMLGSIGLTIPEDCSVVNSILYNDYGEKVASYSITLTGSEVPSEVAEYADIAAIVQQMRVNPSVLSTQVYELTNGGHAFVFKEQKNDFALSFSDDNNFQYTLAWDESPRISGWLRSGWFSLFMQTPDRSMTELNCFHSFAFSLRDQTAFGSGLGCKDCDYDPIDGDYAVRVWHSETDNENRYFVLSIAEGECDATSQGQSNII